MKLNKYLSLPFYEALINRTDILPVWIKRIIAPSAIILLIGLGFINQPFYPTTWQDEGFSLQGAINLVQYGQYAMRSSEGFRLFDQPLLANGPGVVLPISAVFAIFGIGLLQARIVMAFFLIGTSVLWYYLARSQFGSSSAFISSLFLIAIPQEGFLLLGRQALGMIPSFGYFVIGFLLWQKSIKSKRIIFEIIAGIFFALAMVTKGQYLFLFPIFIFVILIDIFYIHIGTYKNILFVLLFASLGVMCWYIVQIAVSGWDLFLHNLASLSSSAKVTISAFRIARVPGNLFYLVNSGILLVILPGWFYGLWEIRKLGKASIGKLFLIIFIPLWLFWYAFVSVGWHRYAFDPYAVGTIFAGKLMVDIFSYLHKNIRSIAHIRRIKVNILLISLYFFGVIFFAGWELTKQIQAVLTPPDTSPQDFALVIKNSVNPRSIIESWEWEIDALTPNLNYHHPTNDWVDKMTAVLQFGDKIDLNYNFIGYQPDYLIDGPFSKWTGLYVKPLNENCCTLINSAGPYDLYKVKK